LAYEVINALRYKPSIGAKELEQVATALRKYNFLVYPLLADTLAEQTIELAVKHGITVYDASYLALGMYLECIAYSADQKIVDKIADEKVIKSISDY
jgi:predicted nucleic acid-binding protein